MQKFDHYVSNLKVLQGAEHEDLSNAFIIGGIIDKFYIQFELSWKILKEFLRTCIHRRDEEQSRNKLELAKESFDDIIPRLVWGETSNIDSFILGFGDCDTDRIRPFIEFTNYL